MRCERQKYLVISLLGILTVVWNLYLTSLEHHLTLFSVIIIQTAVRNHTSNSKSTWSAETQNVIALF